MDAATVLDPLSREELYSVHQFLTLESGSHPKIHRNSTKSELLSYLGETLLLEDALYCVDFFDNYDYYPVPWLKSELLDSLTDDLLQVLVSSFLDDPDIPEGHAALVERLTQSRYFLKEDARKFYLWHHYFQNRVSLEESEEKFARSREAGSGEEVRPTTLAFESPFTKSSSFADSTGFDDSHTVQFDAFQLESYLVDATAYREKAISTSGEETMDFERETGFRSSDNLFTTSSLRPASHQETQVMYSFREPTSVKEVESQEEFPGFEADASAFATQQISYDALREFVEARKAESGNKELSPETTIQTKSPRSSSKRAPLRSNPFDKSPEETLLSGEAVRPFQSKESQGHGAVTMALDAQGLLELLEEDQEEESPAKPPAASVVETLNIDRKMAAAVSTTGEYELDEASILDDSLDIDESILSEVELMELEEESSHQEEPASSQENEGAVETASHKDRASNTPSPSQQPDAASQEALKKALAQRPIGSLMTPPQIDRVTELLHRCSILGGSYERPQIQAIRLFFQKVLDCWPVQLHRVRDVLKYLQSKEVPLVPMKLTGFEEVAQLLPYGARLSLIHTVLFLIGCKSLSNLERHRDFLNDIAATLRVHPGDVSMFTLFGIGPEEIQLTAFECLEVLGVGLEANEEEIRKAHRDKARRYHPDKFHALGPEFRRLADRKMKEVNMALEILVHRSGRAL